MAGLQSLSLLTAATTLLTTVAGSPLLQFNSRSLRNLQPRQGFVPTGPFLGDFPDPAVINVNGSWIAYSTSTADPNINIPMATSPDLTNWSRVTNSSGGEVDALPTVPAWVNLTAAPAGVWAPDVAEWVPGTYTLLYSAFTVMDSREHCIGLATSNSPTGPFTPVGTDPLICPLDQGGAIDASHFRDPEDGSYYIAYKIDGGSTTDRPDGSLCANTGSSTDVPTPLMLQRVSDPSTFAFDGAPVVLLQNNGAPDEGDIEAPSILYIPPLDGSGTSSALQKRAHSYTTEIVYETTTYCPEDDNTKPTVTAIQTGTSSSDYNFAPPGGYSSAPPPPSSYPTATTTPVSPPPSTTPESSSAPPPPPSTSSAPPPPPSTSSAPPPPPTTSSAPPPPPSTTSSSSSESSAPPPPPSSTTASSSSSSSATSTSSSAPPPPSPSGGTYILFFSPGCFADPSYAIDYAVSTNGVAGPYERRPNLLQTNDGGLRSPGGLTAIGVNPADRIAAVNGGTASATVVYHAGIPAPNGTRSLYTGQVVWDGNAITLEAPLA